MADLSGEQMQAKITAARREAEGLKDKIKRRKDELADTSRATPITRCCVLRVPFFKFFLVSPQPVISCIVREDWNHSTDFSLPSSP